MSKDLNLSIKDLKCCGNCEHGKEDLELFPCGKFHWSKGHHKVCKDWKFDQFENDERMMRFK